MPDATHPCLGTTPPATWRHVVWVVMENKPASAVTGRPDTTYLTHLVGACGWATDYHAVTHPSLPNYLALTSGSSHGVTDDGSPAEHPVSGPSIFSEAQADGGWVTYAESMPGPCDQGSSGTYAVKHNPAAYYTDLAAACPSHDLPMGGADGRFATALARGTLPSFTLLIPDLCHDTHDCPVATGDTWLRNTLSQVLDSPDYRAGTTALFVTWDEDDRSAGNHVGLVAVAPSVRPGTRAAGAYGHLTLLRTTEDLLGLGSVVPDQPSMRAAFHL